MQNTASRSASPSAAAARITAARAEKRVLEVQEAAAQPLSESEGYAVQRERIEACGEMPVAWKLGGVNAPARVQFKTDRPYVGPIFASQAVNAEKAPVPLDFPQLRTRKAEVEIAFTFARDVDVAAAATPGGIEPLIKSMHLAIEMPDTCLADPAAMGLGWVIADHCTAGALIVGRALPFSAKLPQDKRFTLHAGEELLAEAALDSLLAAPIELLAEMLPTLVRQAGGNLRAGTVVTTGGITPCVNLPAGAGPVTANWQGVESIHVTFATPSGA